MYFRFLVLAVLVLSYLSTWGGSSPPQKMPSSEGAGSVSSSPRGGSTSEQGVIGTITNRLNFSRDLVLGSLIKNSLETMHFSKKKVDDKISEKAFEALLERLDFTKQFLLKKDIEKLSKYRKKMDDELLVGRFESVEEGSEILKKRVLQVEAYVMKLLKKPHPFDYKKPDFLETDPEKRDYVKSFDELKELWRKILKYETLSRYKNLKEEQDTPVEEGKKGKKGKGKKSGKKKGGPEKKLTEAQLQKKAVEEVKKTYKRVFKRLSKEKKRDELDKFFNSITHVYDPHTSYMTPENKEDFDIRMSGKLEGIGAVLREDGSYIKVERIIPGSASWRQKELKAEDIILKVAQDKGEPVSIVDMGIQDAVKYIRGKKGTIVRLTVKKPEGLIKVIAIKRDVVEIEDTYVKHTVLQVGKGSKMGYIFVPSFYRDFSNPLGRNATNDVLAAIKEIKRNSVKGLILDLRNNGGGALEDARGVAGLFIPQGPIVQVKSSRGDVEVLEDKDGKVYFEKPMVVLVNRFSASASEIVAAALQDYGRAVIIGGEHSHGKGTVQAVLDLDNSGPISAPYRPLGSLKLTIQKFYRVNGISTQKLGVTPDIVLPDPFAHLETGEMYLDYALESSRIEPLAHSSWKKRYELADLKKASRQRVGKSSSFSKMRESAEWYKKRKEKTKKEVSLKAFVKERDEIQKQTDYFKLDKENSALKVLSLKKKMSKLDKEKFEEFSSTLRKDPYIEESLHILEDMGQAKGK